MFKNLQKIDSSKVITSPYPHLVIDNFLDTSTVEKLHDELRFNLSKENANEEGLDKDKAEETNEAKNVKQFGAFYLNQKILDNNAKLKVSSEVNRFFNAPEFIESLVNKLSGFLENCTGFEKDFFINKTKNMRFESRLSFVPPSNASKRREIHLDDSTLILVFLYYIRLPEDYSFGGSLNLLSKEERYLFKSKIGTLACDLLNIYPSDLSIEKTYDYTDNRLIVICSSGYSWHEVSTRRYAATPRISFHGYLETHAKDNKLTKFGHNRNLRHPLKNKLKHLIGLFK